MPRVRALGGAATALLLVLPIVHLVFPEVVDTFTLVLVIEIMVFVLFAASLHFIMGPGGLVSFGHAAYFGGGAYAAALLVKFAHAPFELAFWAAPVGGALLAFLFGWFCVRLSGVYFAMLTLAFAQIAWAFVFQDMPGSVLKIFGIADEFGTPLRVTGGDDGLNDIWPSRWASTRIAYYYITVGLTVAALWIMRRLLYAPFGYTLRAGRDSPLRAAAIGNRSHAPSLAGLYGLRRVCRPCRRPVPVLEGQCLPDHAGNRALLRRFVDGAPRRRAVVVRPDLWRRPDLAQ